MTRAPAHLYYPQAQALGFFGTEWDDVRNIFKEVKSLNSLE